MADVIVDGKHIETAWYGPPPERAPTLVLLHEGLGCVAMWRDFPKKLAAATGYGVLVYSRFCYGKSDPAPNRGMRYMHDEGLRVLPALLDAMHVRKCILVGHSDGASIATIYAGGVQDFRIRGVVLMAPHFFVEEMNIDSIEAAKNAYERGDLRTKLARYHTHVDAAFHTWADAWLSPEFRGWRIDDALAHIRVPILILQGKADQYATEAQLELAQSDTYCPVEIHLLDACGHSPQIDQPQATLAAITEFVSRILAMHEGLAPAA